MRLFVCLFGGRGGGRLQLSLSFRLILLESEQLNTDCVFHGVHEVSYTKVCVKFFRCVQVFGVENAQCYCTAAELQHSSLTFQQ